MSIQFIESKISQYEIMKRYFPGDVVIGKSICSPFRVDNKPGCVFSYYKNKLRFTDFALGYNADCYDIASRVLNTDLSNTLKRIIHDFDLSSLTPDIEYLEIQDSDTPYERPEEVKRSKIVYKVIAKRITKKDKEYWAQYGIPATALKSYNIHSVNKVFSKPSYATAYKEIYGYVKEDDLCYAYVFDNRVKLYKPYGKKDKWFGNTNKKDIQGYRNLPEKGELLVIASSFKDALTLIFNTNISAIAPQSEVTGLPKEEIESLKERFKQIYIILDSDEAGIYGSQKLSYEHKLEYILLPPSFEHEGVVYTQKDIADYRKVMSADTFDFFINSLIKKQNAHTTIEKPQRR